MVIFMTGEVSPFSGEAELKINDAQASQIEQLKLLDSDKLASLYDHAKNIEGLNANKGSSFSLWRAKMAIKIAFIGKKVSDKEATEAFIKDPNPMIIKQAMIEKMTSREARSLQTSAQKKYENKLKEVSNNIWKPGKQTDQYDQDPSVMPLKEKFEFAKSVAQAIQNKKQPIQNKKATRPKEKSEVAGVSFHKSVPGSVKKTEDQSLGFFGDIDLFGTKQGPIEQQKLQKPVESPSPSASITGEREDLAKEEAQQISPPVIHQSHQSSSKLPRAEKPSTRITRKMLISAQKKHHIAAQNYKKALDKYNEYIGQSKELEGGDEDPNFKINFAQKFAQHPQAEKYKDELNQAKADVYRAASRVARLKEKWENQNAPKKRYEAEFDNAARTGKSPTTRDEMNPLIESAKKLWDAWKDVEDNDIEKQKIAQKIFDSLNLRFTSLEENTKKMEKDKQWNLIKNEFKPIKTDLWIFFNEVAKARLEPEEE